MKNFNIAILGCGTVGGGVAKIILDNQNSLQSRSDKKINLSKIVTRRPLESMRKHELKRELFANPKELLNAQEIDEAIKDILADPEIDLVVETIGGDSDWIKNIHENILKSGKHLVSANKALIAKTGFEIFDLAKENKKAVGFEAAVCGAIPVIKGIKQCFTGDQIISLSGIMNGTSNFILSKMDKEGLSFESALKEAQERGYAEADPTLDINGGDAASKLKILIQLAFGIEASSQKITVHGIDSITATDVAFAKDIKSVIKLICYAKREGGNIYAAVRPMMISADVFLADINGATNAIRLINQYSAENILVGQGAGKFETASSVVSDIINIARENKDFDYCPKNAFTMQPFEDLNMDYNILMKVKDVPGVTGTATTAVGAQGINIHTVGPNRHDGDWAYFSMVVENTSINKINAAIESMISQRPDVFTNDIKIIPLIH